MDQSEMIYNYEVTNALGHAISSGEHGLGNVPGLLKKIIKGNHWQRRFITQTKREVEFKRFIDFVAAKPLEGLGADVKTLERLCHDDEEALLMLRDATTGNQGEHTGNQYSNVGNIRITNVSNVRKADSSSDDRGYALRRLRKDRPDLHAQVIEKKLSPHAAMVEAGFRPKTITVPVDVEKAAKVLARNFKGEVDSLIEALKKAKK